jgi:hypothetical protein
MRSVAFILTMTVAACGGCEHMNKTEKGALIGSGMGAIAGTAIGAATGNPRTGAVVGALGGGLLGGVAGNSEDRRDADAAVQQARHERDAAQEQASRLGMIDVVTLVQQGTDADVIVNQIAATGSTFTLSTADIQYLTQNQVPAKVIRAMQDSARRPSSTAVRERVIVRDAPVIIERPWYGPGWYAPPPPPIGFGFHYVKVR